MKVRMITLGALLVSAVCLPLQAAEPGKDAAPPFGCRQTTEADCMARMDEQMKAMDDMHRKMMQAPTPDERRGMMRQQMGMMRHMMRMMSDQVRQGPPTPAAAPSQPKPATPKAAPPKPAQDK